ncbi:MAG: hypothetical protein VX346_02100 [Planctomycetota bacterium]|nr:hypothetical protein [Planctomycetota bacterium]
MSTLPATLKLDVRLQARSKLYAIGVVVALLFGFAGRYFVNPNYAGNVLAVFFLIGIGGTTYFFAASLVLLEKSEGTLQALRTTPLTSTAYITSKVFTLTSFALIESAIVYCVAFFGVPLNPAPLIFGVVFLGVIYTLVGLGQVASHDSVTGFLFPGALFVTLIMELPVFFLIGAGPIWYVIPTHGPLLLMLGATETLVFGQWAYAVLVSLLSVVVAFFWARRRFARFIRLQEA